MGATLLVLKVRYHSACTDPKIVMASSSKPPPRASRFSNPTLWPSVTRRALTEGSFRTKWPLADIRGFKNLYYNEITAKQC